MEPSVTGLRLARTDTPGDAPPVLALHGLASNRRWWSLVAGHSRHRLIAADLRGHGESPRPDAGYGVAAVNLVGVTREQLAVWATGDLAAGSDPATLLDILLGNFEALDGLDQPAAGVGLRPRLTLDRHMRIARSLFDLDSAELLARVRVPVVGVLARDPQGGDWQRGREAGSRRAAEILGERLHVVWIDGHHDIPVERPEAVAAAIDAAVAAVAHG